MLEEQPHALALSRAEGLAGRAGDEPQGARLVTADRRPWMQHEPIEAEPLGAIELFDEARDRSRAKGGLRGAEVDEVARMGDARRELRLVRLAPERLHVLVGQLARAPLTGRFREDLQRVAAGRDGAIDGAGYAARDR